MEIYMTHASLSGADQPLQGGLISNHQCRSFQHGNLLLPEIRQGARDRFAGCSDDLSNFLMGQRDLDPHTCFVGSVAMRPFEQKARQPLGCGVGQSQRANLLISGLAIAAQVLCRFEASISVLLQEAQKVIAFYKIELTGLSRLGRDLIWGIGDRGVQAQDLAWLDNLKNQRLAVA